MDGEKRMGAPGQGNSTNLMMDGVVVLDTGCNCRILDTMVETIAEVKVVSSGYQAEYGLTSGAQITAVTKSGSNAFHGSLYDVERNSDWNTNSWANQQNGIPKAVNKQRDYGYTIGGPIGKPGGSNKLFFFYGHEFQPRTNAGSDSAIPRADRARAGWRLLQVDRQPRQSHQRALRCPERPA